MQNEFIRIQHVEDLIFWHGSSGAKYSLEVLESQTQDGYKHTSLKWDGSPGVVFGRDNNGHFIFTDKHGFIAKRYDGKFKSPQELHAGLSARRRGSEPGYQAYIARMFEAWSVFEALVPPSHRGLFRGDMLYFDTPPIENHQFHFTPNVVQYTVPTSSELGIAIASSEAGVAVHCELDINGNTYPLKNVNKLLSEEVLVLPPVKMPGPAQIEPEIFAAISKAIDEHAEDIDALFDEGTLQMMRIPDLGQVFYTYLNKQIDEQNLDNLGVNFIQWLESSKESAAKQIKIKEYLVKREDAFDAVWGIVKSLMQVKEEIIDQFDTLDKAVEQQLNGENTGEGYVINTKSGYLKLVSRKNFSFINRGQ